MEKQINISDKLNYKFGTSILFNNWFNVIIRVTISILFIFIIYSCGSNNDPVKDGKSIANARCNCLTNYLNTMIKVDEKFIDKFDSYNFENKQEARNKFEELQNAVTTEHYDCMNAVQKKNEDLKYKYIAEKELLEKYEFALNSLIKTCNLDESKLNSLENKINEMISKYIKDKSEIFNQIVGTYKGMMDNKEISISINANGSFVYSNSKDSFTYSGTAELKTSENTGYDAAYLERQIKELLGYDANHFGYMVEFLSKFDAKSNRYELYFLLKYQGKIILVDRHNNYFAKL